MAAARTDAEAQARQMMTRAEEAAAKHTETVSPVAITVMGGGGFPGAHPLTTGMVGMHGTQASNTACDQCDLLIAVGCRFSDRVALDPASFASQAKIVQIDIDRSEIDKNILTDHHIIGSAKRVLELLNQRVPQYHRDAWKVNFCRTFTNSSTVSSFPSLISVVTQVFM